MKNLVCGIVILLLVACKATPEKVAYTGISAVGMTADAGIGTFNNYIKSHPGEISNEKILEVRKAAVIYDKSLDVVQATITSIKQGKATDADYQIAIAASSAAASNLTALLSVILPQLKN